MAIKLSLDQDFQGQTGNLHLSSYASAGVSTGNLIRYH
jgi:hypothetical protein